MAPKKLNFFAYPKNAKFYADLNPFNTVIGNKCTWKKLLAENVSKLAIEKSAKSKYLHFFDCIFLISNLFAFFSTVFKSS
jgi:hypothetical protein